MADYVARLRLWTPNVPNQVKRCALFKCGALFNAFSFAYSMNVSATFSPPRRSPSSALHCESVHITDVSDISNPCPSDSKGTSSSVNATGSRPAIDQDYLTPLKLVHLSNEPDLSRVTFLELTVNTTENSLGNFGKETGLLVDAIYDFMCYSCITCACFQFTSNPSI